MPSASLCKLLRPPARPRDSSPQSGETAVSAVSVLYVCPQRVPNPVSVYGSLIAALFSLPIVCDLCLTLPALTCTVYNNFLTGAPSTRTARAASHLLPRQHCLSKGNVIVLFPCMTVACKIKSKLPSEMYDILHSVPASPLSPLSCALAITCTKGPIPHTGLALPPSSLPLYTLLPAPGKFFSPPGRLLGIFL